MDAEDAMDLLENWEWEGGAEWFAVDELTPGDATWKKARPASLRRLFVGSREEASNFVTPLARRPGEGGFQPFYRVVGISAEAARDYFVGVASDEYDSSEMLTLADAAETAGISKGSMHSRVVRGRTPAVLVGGTYYVNAPSVDLFEPKS